jgi:hypothetical protein
VQQRAENGLDHGLDGLILEIECDLALRRAPSIDRRACGRFIDELAGAWFDMRLGFLMRFVFGVDVDRLFIVDLARRLFGMLDGRRRHFTIELLIRAKRGTPGQCGGQQRN